MFQHGLARDIHDGFGGAADGPAQGMVTQDGFGKLLVAQVRGIVGIHGDFFQDDVAFLFQFLRVQDRGSLQRGKLADIVLWDADHEGAFAWAYGLRALRVWRGGVPVQA
jgi:hypothetical protein